jgi:hypothetical protein
MDRGLARQLPILGLICIAGRPGLSKVKEVSGVISRMSMLPREKQETLLS